MSFLQALKAYALDLSCGQNVPMSQWTTLRVGGAADFFVSVRSNEDVRACLKAAWETNTPVLFLGHGSNILVCDGGIEGLVLHMGENFSKISVQDGCIKAQAGAMLSALARTAMEQGLTGLEFAGGIPGSLGGAVYMNAGAYGGEMQQVVKEVTVLENGEIRTLSGDEMAFSYRHSRVMETGGLALSAVLSLQKGEQDKIRSTMNDLNARRRDKQPLQYPSAGSFFKRPEGHFAGALIEQAGLKGFSVGGAQVSEKHAGFIVNKGGATASDVLALMTAVQERVKTMSGVSLTPEVRIVGREK